MTAVGATATSNTVRRDVCFRAEPMLASTADIGRILLKKSVIGASS